MKRTGLTLWAVLGCLLAQVAQGAEKRKMTLGVFLPSTMADAQERFHFAEKLAAGLGAALGEPVVGRSFGRYEDFTKAASDGSLDVAVVDGWAAAESTTRLEPLSLASMDGDTHQPWVVVGKSKAVVKDLKGKRLAIIKGSGSGDAKLVTNVIFGGDLDAQKHFGKLVTVPSVESALKLLDVSGADAVLVPASHAPKSGQVLFKSSRVLGAVVVGLHGRAQEIQTALRSLGAVEPFEKFVDAPPGEVSDFRKQILTGPARRQPVVAESPSQRLDASTLVNPREMGPVLPSFLETMDVSREEPDD